MKHTHFFSWIARAVTILTFLVVGSFLVPQAPAQAFGCNATSLDAFTANPSTLTAPGNVSLSWNGTNSCEFVFISTNPLAPSPTWTLVTFPPFTVFNVNSNQVFAIRGYDVGILPSTDSATVSATPPSAERTLNITYSPAPVTPPPSGGATVQCVGAPPANPQTTVTWNAFGLHGGVNTSGSVNGWEFAVCPFDAFQLRNTGGCSQTYVPYTANPSRTYTPTHGVANDFWIIPEMQPQTDELWIDGPVPTCNANLQVRVVDENNNPLSGATWSVSGGAQPGFGSGTSVNHVVRPATLGSMFTASGFPASIGGRTLIGVTSSDGSGGTVTLTPGQSKWVQAQYGPAALPCSIDIRANGSHGPISVTSGSNVNLTWTSINTNTTSGVGFNSAGATQNTIGVTVNPTVNTTYTINGTGAGGNCSDSVTVNVTAPPPSPAVSLSAMPSCNGTDPRITLTWSPANFTGSPTYTVRRNNAAGPVIYSGTATSFVDSGLTPGLTYTYHLAASFNAEAASNSASATAPTCAGAPVVAATAVSSCAGPNSTITVSWSATNNPSNYVLRRDNPSGLLLYSGPATSFTDGSRTGGVTYTYYLEAIGPGGTGTRIVSATALDCSAATPSVDIRAAVSLAGPWTNGPLTLAPSQALWLDYTRAGFTPGDPVQCTMTYSNPFTDVGGISVPGSAGPINSWHPYYPPAGGRSYTVSCQNLWKAGESASDSVTVFPPPPAAPTVSLSATPTAVVSGGSTQLAWSSTNATSCTASASPANGQWTGLRALSGTTNILNLIQTTTFTISCTGPGGTTNASATVTVTATPPPPPAGAIDLRVNGLNSGVTILSGQQGTITWTGVGNLSNCTASVSPALDASWTGFRATSGSQLTNMVAPRPVTLTYQIVCNDTFYGGTPNDSVTVTFAAATPAPTVSLFAAPTSVTSGGSTALTWSSTNATSCTASASPANGQWVGSRGTTGSQVIVNMTQSTTFTLTCTGPGGTGNASASVTVGAAPPPPAVSLSVNPITVNSGQTSTITWSSTNATSCTASASPANTNWSGLVSTAGSVVSSPLTSTTQFSISCTGPGGVGNASAIVTVNVAASQITVVSNLPSSWTIANAVPSGGVGISQNHSATPAPGGTMYTLSGVQVIPGYSVSVTNNVSAGSSATLFPGQSVTFTITYSPTGGFDYSLTNTGNVTVTQAPTPVTGQSVISLNLLSGASQPVSLTPTGIPTGVAWSFAPTTCNPTCTATLALTVAPSAVPGTYPITVTGTSAGLPNRNTAFNLVINPPAAFSVVCTAAPSLARVNQQVTWTAIPSGGTPPYTFLWNGTDIVGSPNANPYVHTYSTVGPKFAAASVTDAMGLNVRCAGVTVQVSVDPEFQEF